MKSGCHVRQEPVPGIRKSNLRHICGRLVANEPLIHREATYHSQAMTSCIQIYPMGILMSQLNNSLRDEYPRDKDSSSGYSIALTHG